MRGEKNILILGISDKLAILILWLVKIVITSEMCWSLLARCSTPAWAVRRVFKSQSSRSLAASHFCCWVCRCCSDSCRACWSLMKQQRKSRGFRTIFIHIHIICPHRSDAVIQTDTVIAVALKFKYIAYQIYFMCLSCPKLTVFVKTKIIFYAWVFVVIHEYSISWTTIRKKSVKYIIICD